MKVYCIYCKKDIDTAEAEMIYIYDSQLYVCKDCYKKDKRAIDF